MPHYRITFEAAKSSLEKDLDINYSVCTEEKDLKLEQDLRGAGSIVTRTNRRNCVRHLLETQWKAQIKGNKRGEREREKERRRKREGGRENSEVAELNR